MCEATYKAHNTKAKWEKVTPVHKDPPCATCRPGLNPDNVQVLKLYRICADQWEGGEGECSRVANTNVESAMRIMATNEGERLHLLTEFKVLTARIAEVVSAEKERQRELHKKQ